jgi:hypothetical protein
MRKCRPILDETIDQVINDYHRQIFLYSCKLPVDTLLEGHAVDEEKKAAYIHHFLVALWDCG